MKTLSLQEAEKIGFTVIKFGLDRYLPVALPREVAFQDAASIIADQFNPRFEAGSTTDGDREEGYFTQVIEDTRGSLGLPGTVYIVRANYTRNDGIQDWELFGAVKLS